MSVSTQIQALSVPLLMYCLVHDREFGDLGNVIRARIPKRLLAVVTPEEAEVMLVGQLHSDKWLMASLMYVSELRLTVGGTASALSAMKNLAARPQGCTKPARCADPVAQALASGPPQARSRPSTARIRRQAGGGFSYRLPQSGRTAAPPPIGSDYDSFCRKTGGLIPD